MAIPTPPNDEETTANGQSHGATTHSSDRSVNANNHTDNYANIVNGGQTGRHDCVNTDGGSGVDYGGCTTSQYDESPKSSSGSGATFEPIAICGMACRLPGGINSPNQLWDFLIERRDGRIRVPKTRFNSAGFYSATKRPGSTNTEYGYFLDDSVDLGGLDTSFFSMSRKEVEWLDPQQRLMLEVARESLDDAGETDWRGSNTGVYVGSFGQDWAELLARDPLRHNVVSVITSADFMISERLSHEMDLHGPSMTIRTACSSSLVGLNEACMAITKGDCESAIVGGTNLILAPDLMTRLADQGILSPDGECRTFSANANGYARGEAIVSIYVKSLSAAIRDGNPIRSVISGSAANFDGKTNPLTMPSAKAQEALIRRAYEVAGISDFSKTALFECHGTGTATGDPIETEAVASIFGEHGIYLGAVKPNLGHSEGASGLAAVIKATLALEHLIIPPNIKYAPLNPKIPFERAKLQVPEEATAWPAHCDRRVSINSFGVGGSNAHIILESAAEFACGVADCKKSQTKTQLLLFSANTQQSLKDMVQSYQSFLCNNEIALADLAFTLANRREHLLHRSFALASPDKIEPALIGPTQANQVEPSLVMVFTGQGAAWPRVGRELLQSNRTFARTIRSLDKCLQDLGAAAPCWSLEEELLKSAKMSRIYEAEFSQPLCTAVQIGLVDTLAAAGITPAAVVGHSSGEIAAAYAARGLTSEESIVIAFLRGASTKQQTTSGGMAAVGLSWEEVQKYLVPGVMTACDNSPRSVTLSGDTDRLESVVADIKEQHPDVPATILRVEKAYHSHHMLALGQGYHEAMITAGVSSTAPSIPFFSSVTGQRLCSSTSTKLGPEYWRANLEQPVLFKRAILSVLKAPELRNPIFLEIGPHSALAGPLRQTLAFESSNAPYVPSLVRRQDSVENLMQAIGHLYTLRVKIDFQALFEGGTCISGLPHYPWDHHRRFWFESRVSKEWRERNHPQHDLLGCKSPESTDLEPIWRSLLDIRTVPWLQDHRIGETVVFPFAGYISMAAEAVRQATGIQDGVSLRDVAVSSALVVDQDEPTETVTSLRRHRLTDGLDSEWWEFTISSHNGHVWTKHCWGQVRGEASYQPYEITEETSLNLPRRVDVQRWYEAARRQGLTYGPTFNTMEDVKTSTCCPDQASSSMRNFRLGDESQYHIHPIVLDTMFQLESCSNFNGVNHAYRRLVMARLDSMTMYRCTDEVLNMFVTTVPTAKGCVGAGQITTDSRTVLRMKGSHASTFQENDFGVDEDVPITARAQWVPHIDFRSANDLIRTPISSATCASLLVELSNSAIALASSIADEIVVQRPHLIKYKEWLSVQTSTVAKLSTATAEDISSLVQCLEQTPVSEIASAIATISRDMEQLLRGEKTGLEILTSVNALDSVANFLRCENDSSYLQCLAQTKPNLRVLEVGAGMGSKTSHILKSLTRPDGTPLYSRYVVADRSQKTLNTAKERLQNAINVEFITLDLDVCLAEQDLDCSEFDLIIASGTVNKSLSISESLKRLLSLLSTSGRLLLEEPRPGLLWTKYILGSMPSWWSNVDENRALEPFISAACWEKKLSAAGFTDLKRMDLDTDCGFNTIITARGASRATPKKQVSVLCDRTLPGPTLVMQELEAIGYNVDCVDFDSLRYSPAKANHLLVLLDEERPFLSNMGASAFSDFKSLVENQVGFIGILWVTRFSGNGHHSPDYAQVIGLSRTIRSETSLPFATCEMARITSSTEAKALTSVLRDFQAGSNASSPGPDYEYAIHNGETFIRRIFPFSIEKEMLIPDASNEARLAIGQPGRLNTLSWVSKSAVVPQDKEVEIEVYAGGLNFRDVLVGMQIIPGSTDPSFGYEASGVVKRVGKDVTKLQVGDRAVVMTGGTFSTAVTASELLCEKLPDDINFIDAACIPTIFLTVVYGLVDLAHLSSGQSVLIHSGCGGVGLSAIQVARMLGAEIYITVGSDDKVKYLMDHCGIPRHRIFNSRNTSFAEDLLRETNGKGVDVALNSLAGELLHATWKCVAKFGAMIEIGKRDLLENARLEMNVFLDNRRYCCLDMDQMRTERPETCSRLLNFTMDCFSKGIFKQIRVDQVFSAAAVLDAFRYMQQGRHIGKIVLQIRHDTGEHLIENVETSKKHVVKLDEAASYLLVGGLGGLGRSVAVWMVQRGAKHLVFLSRSAGHGKHDAEFAREIGSMGCSVQFVRGDVANANDVATAVDGTKGSLKGIIQMSMVLRDQMFESMSLEDWNTVTRPKVQGTWNLHEVASSRNLELDFFLLFSSLSGILGQVGQANYASANTFLDAFVDYRISQNLPCTAIDLGAMEGVGYLSNNQELLRKMQGSGWRAVNEIELLESLDFALMSPNTRKRRDRHLTAPPTMGESFVLGFSPTVPLSSPESSTRLREDIRLSIYHNIGNSGTPVTSSTDDQLRDFLSSVKKDSTLLKSDIAIGFLAVEIGKKLFNLILAGDREVDITMSTSDMGLDSLVSVELRGWWKMTFGFDISTLEMLSMGTLEALGKRAVDGLETLYGS